MRTIGWITTIVVIGVCSHVYGGFGLSMLWEWFVVPTFDGPSLSLPVAIGIALIMTYLTRPIRIPKEEPDWAKRAQGAAIVGVVKPTVALAIGWVITWFM